MPDESDDPAAIRRRKHLRRQKAVRAAVLRLERGKMVSAAMAKAPDFAAAWELRRRSGREARAAARRRAQREAEPDLAAAERAAEQRDRLLERHVHRIAAQREGREAEWRELRRRVSWLPVQGGSARARGLVGAARMGLSLGPQARFDEGFRILCPGGDVGRVPPHGLLAFR